MVNEDKILGESLGEVVDIFDDVNEKYLETVPKSYARAGSLPRRGVDVFIFNSKGELLIHKRSKTKEINPGRWDWRVGGWVLSGEKPIHGGAREVFEEIGARNLDLKFILKYRYKKLPDYNDYSYVFRAVYDGIITKQESEVEQYEWINISDLKKVLRERQFTENVYFIFNQEKLFHKIFPEIKN